MLRELSTASKLSPLFFVIAPHTVQMTSFDSWFILNTLLLQDKQISLSLSGITEIPFIDLYSFIRPTSLLVAYLKISIAILFNLSNIFSQTIVSEKNEYILISSLALLEEFNLIINSVAIDKYKLPSSVTSLIRLFTLFDTVFNIDSFLVIRECNAITEYIFLLQFD
jgi:hypothetical protein